MNILLLTLSSIISTTNITPINTKYADEIQNIENIILNSTDEKVYELENGNLRFEKNIKSKKHLSLTEKDDLSLILNSDDEFLKFNLDRNNEFQYLLKNDILTIKKQSNSIKEIDNLYYFINTELDYENGYFINKEGRKIFEIGNNYILSDNNVIIEPIKVNVNDINDNNYLVELEYDRELINSINVSYPLTIISEIDNGFDESIVSNLQNKYIISNTSIEYQNIDSILVGKDVIKTIDSNGNLIDTEYLGVYYIPELIIDDDGDNNLSNQYVVPLNYLQSAQLNLSKKGYSYTNPTLRLSEINFSGSYSNFNGISSYTLSFVQNVLPSQTNISFNILNSLRNNTGDTMYLLQGIVNGYGYAELNSSSSTNFAFEMQTSTYGNAPIYTEDVNSYGNCYGYVMRKEINQNFESFLLNKSYTINLFKSFVNLNCLQVRIINEYNSPIFPNERRIALKFNDVSKDYHFIMQHADGTWSGRSYNGTLSHSSYINPESGDLFGLLFGNDWSEIYYLAIS